MADKEKGVDRHGGDEYTKDGTVDLRGRPFLRAKGGGWAASSFILVSDALERVTFLSVAPNLIVYLTNVLHQGTVASANSVTNWLGTSMIASIFAAFMADSYLGRYWVNVVSNVIYLLGMILLTLAASLPALRPPPCNSSAREDCKNLPKRFQIVVLYYALYMVAFGVAGSKANIAALGAEQFDKFDSEERAQKISFFNWWAFVIAIGNLFATTVITYIENNVSWLLGYSLATTSLAISLLVFAVGTPLYRHKVSAGSPLTRAARVLVAAVRKSGLPHPLQHSININRRTASSSILNSFFDKAAAKTAGSSSEGPWMWCPVSQVEETKQIVRLVPVFIVTIMPSLIVAQVFTVFIKQGATLDQSLGPHFKLPPANLTAVYILSTLVSVAVYDRLLMPSMNKYYCTSNPRGFTSLQRIGIGLAMQTIIMLGAALVERWRLSSIRSSRSASPSTICLLLPQFVLMGIAEVFSAVGKIEFFYDQAPEGMKSMGASLFITSNGIGSFASSFLLSTVAKVTGNHGAEGWIQDDLNSSRLDYYYALVAILSAVNLTLFLFVSKLYVYASDGANCAPEEIEEGSRQLINGGGQSPHAHQVD